MAVAIPTGNAAMPTIVTRSAVPMRPWATPASAGLLDRSDVRKSTPRSANTEAPCESWVPTRPSRTASESRSASSRAPAKTSPEMSRPWRRTERLTATVIGTAVIVRLLVLLPRAAHEDVADDIEHEGPQEEQQPEEEQALERGAVPRHLIATRRERGHRPGEGLARAERVEREQRPGSGSGGERHDHRLADGPRDRKDHRRDDARNRGRDDDPDGCPQSPGTEAVRRL